MSTLYKMGDDYLSSESIYDKNSKQSLEDVIALEGAEDQEPYNFRKSGGDQNNKVFGSEALKSIIGGSVAWNQLANYRGMQGRTESGITFTNNVDGTFTISGVAEAKKVIEKAFF